MGLKKPVVEDIEYFGAALENTAAANFRDQPKVLVRCLCLTIFELYLAIRLQC